VVETGGSVEPGVADVVVVVEAAEDAAVVVVDVP
jgi:hypothetical protein